MDVDILIVVKICNHSNQSWNILISSQILLLWLPAAPGPVGAINICVDRVVVVAQGVNPEMCGGNLKKNWIDEKDEQLLQTIL